MGTIELIARRLLNRAVDACDTMDGNNMVLEQIAFLRRKFSLVIF